MIIFDKTQFIALWTLEFVLDAEIHHFYENHIIFTNIWMIVKAIVMNNYLHFDNVHTFCMCSFACFMLKKIPLVNCMPIICCIWIIMLTEYMFLNSLLQYPTASLMPILRINIHIIRILHLRLSREVYRLDQGTARIVPLLLQANL